MLRRTVAVIVMMWTIMVCVPGVQAEMYTFAGYVLCTTSAPIANELVLVRYVYTFEGVEPHEGRTYVYTDENGLYDVTRDITNIWGSGELLSLVAWSWARDEERYMGSAVPIVPNYFADYEFVCGKPYNGPWPQIEGGLAAEDSSASRTWGRMKETYR